MVVAARRLTEGLQRQTMRVPERQGKTLPARDLPVGIL